MRFSDSDINEWILFGALIAVVCSFFLFLVVAITGGFGKDIENYAYGTGDDVCVAGVIATVMHRYEKEPERYGLIFPTGEDSVVEIGVIKPAGECKQ